MSSDAAQADAPPQGAVFDPSEHPHRRCQSSPARRLCALDVPPARGLQPSRRALPSSSARTPSSSPELTPVLAFPVLHAVALVLGPSCCRRLALSSAGCCPCPSNDARKTPGPRAQTTRCSRRTSSSRPTGVVPSRLLLLLALLPADPLQTLPPSLSPQDKAPVARPGRPALGRRPARVGPKVLPLPAQRPPRRRRQPGLRVDLCALPSSGLRACVVALEVGSGADRPARTCSSTDIVLARTLPLAQQVFRNDFPALLPSAPPAPAPTSPFFAQHPASGSSAVLCFSPRHDLTLARMTAAEVGAVVGAWRTIWEGAKEEYVQLFENRGSMMVRLLPFLARPCPPGCRARWRNLTSPSLAARPGRVQPAPARPGLGHVVRPDRAGDGPALARRVRRRAGHARAQFARGLRPGRTDARQGRAHVRPSSVASLPSSAER